MAKHTPREELVIVLDMLRAELAEYAVVIEYNPHLDMNATRHELENLFMECIRIVQLITDDGVDDGQWLPDEAYMEMIEDEMTGNED